MLEKFVQLNTREMMFSLGLPSPTRMKRRVEAAASNAQRSKYSTRTSCSFPSPDRPITDSITLPDRVFVSPLQPMHPTFILTCGGICLLCLWYKTCVTKCGRGKL